MAEIDPNIALSYRPPNLATMPNLQIQTPLESLARVVSLRSLMQEGELKGLQLQQLRQQIAEQQALSKLYASAYGTDTTQAPTQPLAPVQPNLPAPPPVQPTPAGGTMPAQGTYWTPPATSGPIGAAPGPTGEATGPTRISGWMTAAPTPAPTAAPTPTPVPQPQTPVAAPTLGWPSQFPTPAQIMRAAPISGPAVIKQFTDQQKDLLDLYAKNQTIAKNNTEDFVRLANGSTDNESFQHNLVDMARNGYITSEQARQYSALGFDDPKTQAWLYSTRMQAVSADKAQEMKLALIDDARKGLMFNEQYPAAREDRKQKAYVTASQSIGDLQDKKELPGWIANQDPAVLERYGKYLNSDLPLDQIKRIVQEGAGAGPKAAEAAATKKAEYEEQIRQNEPIIQGVLNGTIKWENVPDALKPALQGEIARRQQAGATPGAPAAGARGVTPGSPLFGKPISDAQRTQLGNYDRGLTILDQTEQDLKNPDKTSTMGPIAGDLANVRWAKGTREFRDLLVARALQLKNYLTSTQRVNPEVMRLIDQIFPTIKTQPDEALVKIHQLQDMIRAERASAVRDMGGMAIPEELRQPPSGGAPTPGQPPPSPTPAPAPAPAPTPAPAGQPQKPSPVGTPAGPVPPEAQKVLSNPKYATGHVHTLANGMKFYKTTDGKILRIQ